MLRLGVSSLRDARFSKYLLQKLNLLSTAFPDTGLAIGSILASDDQGSVYC